MKKFISIVIITSLLSGTISFGQSIDLSLDSITTLLCKKWEVNYVTMGGVKMSRNSNATEINYEFYKDKTYLLTTNNPKSTKKGTWSYDPKKKIIGLTVPDGKNNASITSLKKGELIILPDTKKATSNDPMKMEIVFRIRKS